MRTSASVSRPGGTWSSTAGGFRRVSPAPRTPRTSRSGRARFDDLYELASDRRLGLTGGGRRLTVELEDGYRFAQVFTPPAAASVCLEPMTAAVNALVDGGYQLVSPGASFTARFSLHVEDVS